MNFDLIYLVLGLPLLGFLILTLFGAGIEKALGRNALAVVSVLPIVGAFAAGALRTIALSAGTSTVVGGPDWISIYGLRVPFEWTVDPLSMTMVLIITGIGSLIFLYSTGYMAEEREYSRFFTYLNLFVLAMLVLVLGNNLALLFRRLGGRRSLLLPAHRFLVHRPRQCPRRQQGVRGQPRRRLGPDAGHLPDRHDARRLRQT